LTTAAVAGVLLVGVGDTDRAVILPDAKPPSEDVALSVLYVAWLHSPRRCRCGWLPIVSRDTEEGAR
jgi:hypothetical protein